MQTCTWSSRLKNLKTPVFVCWAAALASQIAADWLLRSTELRSPARSFVIFVPALGWIVLIALFVRAILGLDELQQRIHFQAIALASAPIAILVLFFSALDRAGIYRATISQIGGLALLLLFVGYGFSAWKYR